MFEDLALIAEEMGLQCYPKKDNELSVRDLR